MERKNKKVNIEQSFSTLDKIISEMEKENCSLEKNLELYKKANKIIEDIKKSIDKVEKEIKIIGE